MGWTKKRQAYLYMNQVIEMFMLLVQKQEDRQAPFKLIHEPCVI